MLPIFRLIPVGGVLLAIAILLLALNPPRGTSPSVRAALVPARGALLDRAEHPEWRQFLIQAALRRADEVERLRDLRDTVARTELPSVPEAPAPMAVAPSGAAEPDAGKSETTKPATADLKIANSWPVAAAPDVTEPGPVGGKPEAADPTVAETKPDMADTMPVEAEPEATEPAGEASVTIAEPKPVDDGQNLAQAAPAAAAPKVVATTPVESKPTVDEPKPVADEPKIAAATPIATNPATAAPTPVAVKPENGAPTPTQVASIAPATPSESKPAAVTTPSQPESTAPTFRLETDGTRVRAETALPTTVPAGNPPSEVKVAAVPVQPVQHNDDITGSIEEPAASDATIPISIGEASSTELQVELPRERPPVLLRLDRRARESKVEPARRRVQRISRTRTRKANRANQPPEFDFFALLFKAFAGELKPQPFTPPTIPYQPNNNWRTQ